MRHYMLLALAVAFLDVSCGMLDSATMQGLLDLHNEFRQKAATEGNGISNMKQMAWLEELATNAENHASECVHQPSLPTAREITALSVLIGEHLHASYNDPNQAVIAEVRTILEEGESEFQGNGGSCDGLSAMEAYKCTYYLQVVWAETSHVGCGAAKCGMIQNTEEFRSESYLLVCHYAPIGAISGEDPNIDGSTCSNCDSSYIHCYEDLCSQTGEKAETPPPDIPKPPSPPAVSGRTPWYGSYSGGTRLTITGRRFSPDPFTLGNDNVGNKVYFVYEDQTLECPVETYYSNTDQIVCFTPPSPTGGNADVWITIIVDGNVAEEYRRRFHYRNYNNPELWYITPSGPIGETILIQGRLYTVDVVKRDEENSDGDIVEDILLSSSGINYKCSVDKGGLEYYPAFIEDDNTGNVTCLPNIGESIDSFFIDYIHETTGSSIYLPNRLGLSANGFKPYLYQTHAEILSVEPNEGSVEGGTVITISGRGFYPQGEDNIKVLIGGIECKVLSYSSSKIECISGPKPQDTQYYPGSRGLKREIWFEGFRWDLLYLATLDSSDPGYVSGSTDIAWVETGYPSDLNESTLFMHRMSGFFVPPESGRYTFDILSDDLSQLFISLDGNPESKDLIAEAPAHTRGRWDYFESQRSNPVDLEGGKSYYLEALHNQGGGPYYLYLGAKFHNSTLTRSEVPAEHEIQRFIIDAPIVKPEHQICINVIPQTLGLNISCDSPPCCYNVTINGTVIGSFSTTESVSEVEDYLNSLGPAIVTVDGNNMSEGNINLTITFYSLPHVASWYNFIPCNSSTFVIKEVTEGSAPESITVTYSDIERKSYPHPATELSANDLRLSILNLTKWACNKEELYAGVSDVFWYRDYEGDDVGDLGRGERDTGIDPFCGRHSLKTPRYIYRNSYDHPLVEDTYNNDGFSIEDYKWVCFASFGPIPRNILRIIIDYERFEEDYSRIVQWAYNIPLNLPQDDPYEGWRYHCVDIYKYIKVDTTDERLSGGAGHRILQMYFYSTNNDFWIDEVSIHQSVSSNWELLQDQGYLNSIREPPIRPNGVYIDDIKVEKYHFPSNDLFIPGTSTINRTKLSSFLKYSNDSMAFSYVYFIIIYYVHFCHGNVSLPQLIVSGACGEECVSVEHVNLGSTPIEGTFDISFKDNLLKEIDINVETDELREYLEEGLAGYKFAVEAIEPRCHRREWKIEFSNKGGDQPALQVHVHNLSSRGTLVTATVHEDVHGGIFFRPIRGDMLRQPHREPQVEVLINNIPSSCPKNMCSFNHTDDKTPKVFGVFPSGGSAGTIVTILGEGFSDDKSVIVTIGKAVCEITSINSSTIMCTAGNFIAGPHKINVLVSSLGYARHEEEKVYFSYSLTVDSVSANSGSHGGGTVITLTGNGFPDIPDFSQSFIDCHRSHKQLDDAIFGKNCVPPTIDDMYFGNNSNLTNSTHIKGTGCMDKPSILVEVAGYPCLILKSNLSCVTCLSPKNYDFREDSLNITVTVGDRQVFLPNSFSYVNESTPYLNDYEPMIASVLDDITVTFYGEFPDIVPEVYFIQYENCSQSLKCEVQISSRDNFTCSVMGGQMDPGHYIALINFPGYGYPVYCYGSIKNCSHRDHPIIQIEFYVSLVSPSYGSILGGTQLTLAGKGFPVNRNNDVSVKVGGKECSILSVNATSIQCSTSGLQKTHPVQLVFDSTSFAWSPSILDIEVGDTVTWSWDYSQIGVDLGLHQLEPGNETSAPHLDHFRSVQAAVGSFKYRFDIVGIYHYKNYPLLGFADFFGEIRVKPRLPVLSDIHVQVGRFSTRLPNEGISKVPFNETENFEVPTYYPSTWVPPFYPFTFSPRETPEVTALFSFWTSPNKMIKFALANFTGNLTSASVSLKTLNGSNYGCDKILYSGNMISCQPDVNDEPPVGVPLTLCVNVVPCGNALIASGQHDRITFYPVISGVFPSSVSILGGAILTVDGYGFSGYPSVVVDGYPCPVLSYKYNSIKCLAPNLSINESKTVAVNVTISVSDDEIPFTVSAACSDDCSVTYSIESTVVVESLDPLSIPGTPNNSIQIEGTFLNSNISIETNPITIYFFPYTEGLSSLDYLTMNDLFMDLGDKGKRSLSNTPKKRNSDLAMDTVPVCKEVEFNNGTLYCEVPGLSADQYAVIVSHNVFGDALTPNYAILTITVELVVESVSPNVGSTAGGTEITLYGGGFSDSTEDILVILDGSICDVKSVSFCEVTCVTSPHLDGLVTGVITVLDTMTEFSYNYSSDVTPVIESINSSMGNYGDVLTVNLTRVKAGSNVIVFIGQRRCAIDDIMYSSGGAEVLCRVPVYFVGTQNIKVWVDPVGYAVGDFTFEYILLLDSVTPNEGSFAGQSELVITGKGFDPADVKVYVCDILCPPSLKQPSVSEITCILPTISDYTPGSGRVEVCDVIVATRSVMQTLYRAFNYSDELTPIIEEVSPKQGGSAGGTHIVVKGQGFESATVTIASVPCEITMQNSTHIKCRTGASRRTITSQVVVHVKDKGVAYSTDLAQTTFRYVDLWSSVYTWNGSRLPEEGSFVIVPKGQTLSLDIDTPVLKILLIDGGTLLFDDNQDVTLRAENIIVVNDGIFQVGTEEEPFCHKAEIILYGNVLSTEVPLFGAKTLAVRHGTLDLHGKPVNVTWTKLSKTAEPGDTELHLQEAVDWEIGGRIVIAATGFSQRENEEAYITDIDPTRTIITIGRIPRPDESLPLANVGVMYQHISAKEIYNGQVVDMSGEVGYLTRNVKVRGNFNEEWIELVENCPEEFRVGMFETQTCFRGRFGAELETDQFGSQIMLHAREQDQHHVTGRIEYVEVTHAGQAFRLGRYPIHFHLNGNVSGSYVRGCGIHHTFNRAVTIHGVNYLLVEKNVAFNVLGHAYFLEDGIEIGNVIQDNLGVFVRASSSLLNVDITPATFWIVNPNNTVRRNAAAGGTHFGFWYRLDQHPTGPSATTSVCPRHIPIQEFSGNTAHSFGWYGIWVFPSYHPRAGGSCSFSAPFEKSIFSDFIAWRNTRGVEFTEVGSLQLVDSILIDNMLAGVEVVDLSQTCWGEDGPLIKNVTIVGHSEVTSNQEADFCTESGIKTPKSDYLTVSNVTFYNFDKTRCHAITACAHCKVFQGGFRTNFEGLRFYNSPEKVDWKWEHEHVHFDLDGTLTGKSQYSLTPYHSALDPISCQIVTLSSTKNDRPDSALCNSDIKLQRVAFDTLLPPSLDFNYLIITNNKEGAGTTRVPWRLKRLSKIPGLMAVLPLWNHYNLHWENTSLTNISYTARFNKMTTADYLWFNHQFPLKIDRLLINGVMTEAKDSIPAADDGENGDWHFSEITKTAYYLIEGGSDDVCTSGADNTIAFTTYKCEYLDCIPPPPPPEPTLPPPPNATFYWSDNATWPGKVLPQEGDAVFINCSQYVILDISIPRLKSIEICGVLKLDNSLSHIIQTEVIYIKGGKLIVGDETEPFQNNVTIILYGNTTTPEFPVPLKAPAVGSKAIGVFGELSMYADTHEVTWTFLAESVCPNDSTLVLVEQVTWQIGEEIVISSTSYEPLEAETFTIADISNDGLTITIDGKFQYEHIAQVGVIDTFQYAVRAEVGVLSRRIKIVNGDPDFSDKEAFGCRMIVGHLEENGLSYVGRAQIHGVEFDGCGQKDYTFIRDPRFALAFLNTGDAGNVSYVRKSSFHDGYNVGIGSSGTDYLHFEENIVHNQVGHSFWLAGKGYILKKNLAVVALFPGLYRGADEPENFDYTANFELLGAEYVTLLDNSAAGGQRVGFRLRGEPCDGTSLEAWSRNIAHSTLFGILTSYKDGHPSGCSLYREFTAYSCYHFGLFTYSAASVVVQRSVFINNKAAIHTNVIGPAALSHLIDDKSVIVDNVLVSSYFPSQAELCNSDTCERDKQVPAISAHPKSFSGITTKWGRHVGIIMSAFTSGGGLFPKSSLQSIITYPAINGSSLYRDVLFNGFDVICGRCEVALMTNSRADDAIHPVAVEGIKWSNSNPNQCGLYMHEPPLAHVNPSDCVDMDCDGHKHTLVKDMDGSFTVTDSPRTVVAMAEFEWNGDRRRGFGEFRIPKTMLTNPDGSRIPIESIYPYPGIVRGIGNDQDCTYNEAWRAHECINLDHVMLVLESLDPDTEVRRLSPIGIGSSGFIDLLNGPQDHGWCGGYTCQERISTFYAIVATGLHYSIALTSTNPQQMRILMLNADQDASIIISLIYFTSQRLDVYVNGNFDKSTGEYENGQYVSPKLNGPVNVDDPHGSNSYSRPHKAITVNLRGSREIVIIIAPVIQLSLELPPITVDEFFEANLIQNLALLFNIPKSKIRIVNAVAEDSSRKRRESVTVVNVEIGEEAMTTVENTTNSSSNVSTEELTFTQLTNLTTEIVNKVQTGELAEGLNVTILSADVQEPEPPAVDPTEGVRATNGTGGPLPGEVDNNTLTYSDVQLMEDLEKQAEEAKPTTYSIPTTLEIYNELDSSGVEGVPFSNQPKLRMLDGSGNIVENLGFGQAWLLTSEIISEASQEVLILNNVVPFVNGWANYSDLAISHPGSGYQIRFRVSYPSSATFSTVSSNIINIEELPLKLVVTSQPTSTFPEIPLNNVTVELVEFNSGMPVINHGWRRRTWSVEATILLDGQSVATVKVELSNGRATFPNIILNTTGTYVIRFTAITVPETPSTDEGYPSYVESIPFEVKPAAVAELQIIFDADYDVVVAGKEDSFIPAFKEFMEVKLDAIVFDIKVSKGSIIVDFSALSEDEQKLRGAYANLASLPANSISFLFNGQNLTASSFTVVSFVTLDHERSTPPNISVILAAVLGSIGGVIFLLVLLTMCGFFCCKCKRSTKKYDEDWESNVNLQNFNPDAHSRPSLEDPHYEESPLKKSAESFQMISTKTFIQETPLTFANPEADSSDEPNIYTAVTESTKPVTLHGKRDVTYEEVKL